MSSFDELWNEASGVADREFEELVDLVPQVTGSGSKYFSKGDDPTQPSREVAGIFDMASIIDTVKGSGANTHENVDVLTQMTSIEFDEELFDATHPLPKAGWFVIAKKKPRGPRYVIIDAEPDGYGKIVCKISFRDFSAP